MDGQRVHRTEYLEHIHLRAVQDLYVVCQSELEKSNEDLFEEFCIDVRAKGMECSVIK